MLKSIIICIFFVSTIFAGDINWSKDNLEDTINISKNKKQKIIMAYFWKKGCNACEYMRDRVFNKEEVSIFINDNFIPYKTNIIPDDYSIFAYPTIYFIDQNGEILAEPVMGARNLDEFILILEDIKEDFSN